MVKVRQFKVFASLIRLAVGTHLNGSGRDQMVPKVRPGCRVDDAIEFVVGDCLRVQVAVDGFLLQVLVGLEQGLPNLCLSSASISH